ncbi:MAG: hypothetical protein R2819_04605 [Allomuricauda sp.]
MRFGLCLFLFLLSGATLSAQVYSVKLSHYVFPEFNPGVVLMKNGQKNPAMLNYNSLTEEMVFENNGGKLAIVDTQLQQIDTVYIKGRRFFRHDGKFLELLHQSGYELYAEHKCDVKYPGRPDAFGRTSQTSSSESYTSTNVMGIIYELSLPEGYKTKPYTHYWLRRGGKLEQIKNLNQLLKLYDNKNAGKDYAKSNKLDFENPQDMLQLVEFLEENQGN